MPHEKKLGDIARARLVKASGDTRVTNNPWNPTDDPGLRLPVNTNPGRRRDSVVGWRDARSGVRDVFPNTYAQ